MYEVEVKVPADLEAVRDRLEDLGAARRRTVVQEDTYYDAPHRSFPETDEALRIRRESAPDSDRDRDAESRVTYKGPLLDDESKSREEVETGVADGAKMDAVLTNLGFEAAATVRKERERFTVELERGADRADVADSGGRTDTETYTVTLDTVDDVGEFVEVETDVETERELESAREGAYDVLERLGLDPADQLRTSYLGLLLED